MESRPQLSPLPIAIPIHIEVKTAGDKKMLKESITSKEFRDRLIGRKEAFQGVILERQEKRPPKVKNHHSRDRRHVSILLFAEDSVVLTCDEAFTVEVQKDPDIPEVAAAPDDPFRWSGPMTVAKGKSITGTCRDDEKVREQMFYKFTVRVDGGELDPDIICGFDG